MVPPKLLLERRKRGRGQFLIASVSFLLIATTAVCQSASPGVPLLWYERNKFSIHAPNGESRTCLLVLADGSVHVERIVRNFRNEGTAQAFRGNLTDDEKRELLALLNSPQLRDLRSQSEKERPTVAKELETTAFIIPRESDPQKMYVWESEKQSSKNELLNPLIKWVQQVQKKKFSISPNATMTRCQFSSLPK